MLSRVARFNPGLVLCLVILGPLTYLIHQFGHWATGEALGVDMWLSVAKAGSVDSEFGSRLNRILVVMAGPVLTVLIASIAWWVAKRTGSMIAYGVLCFQFMMRLVAGSIALISGNLNDGATWASSSASDPIRCRLPLPPSFSR
ncbi:hypothetical protein [Maricaulis maris]|uniref:hypothetical protein n=1 Tax=Maricaulis maris TaxID=74318 RepID=UPI003B8BDF4E